MKQYRIQSALALIVALMGGVVAPFITTVPEASAAAPANFFHETLVDGLTLPTQMAFASDGRIFIAEKNGTVRIVKNGVLLPTPFLDISSKVNTAGDRGLLGLALDPSFASNGYVYLAYTYENSPAAPNGPKTGRIVRVRASGDVMVPGSEVILVGKVAGTATTPSCRQYATTSDCIPSDSLSHSVGGLRFGSDGRLYASLGDGAGFDTVDPKAYQAQDVNSLAGKIIRVNKSNGRGLSDNPFYNGSLTSNRSKVWTYGHRNSFRFNFKPGTNTIFMGEVGWYSFEEINVGTKGANLGWPCREGTIKTPGYECTATNPVAPIHTYAHVPGETNAIIGGAFAGNYYPATYRGNYFFGELGTGKIFRMVVNTNNTAASVETFMEGADGPVEFVTGPNGAVYYLSIFMGELRRISYSPNAKPTADLEASPLFGSAPLLVSFDASGSTDPDNDALTYTYNFGNGTVVGPTASSTISHTYTADGLYSAVVTVTDIAGNTDTETVDVSVGDNAGGAIPSFVTTSVSTTTLPVAGRVDITTSVTNDGTPDPVDILVEVRDTTTNAVVSNHAYDAEVIPTGATESFMYEWVPAESGTYAVSAKIMSNDRSVTYEDRPNFATITVYDREPPSEANPTMTSASLSTPHTIGTPVTATVTVKNNGGAGMIDVVMDLYEDIGGVITSLKAQTSPLSFAANETKQVTMTATPTRAGTYFLDAGLFNSATGAMYQWNWRPTSMVVTAGGGTTTPPQSDDVIFADAVGQNWRNWSWETATAPVSTPVADGATALSVTYGHQYGGLYFNHDPFSTAGKTSITVKIHGGTAGGQTLHLFATTEAASLPSVDLTNYGGAPTAGSWKTYTVPLSALSAANVTINGFAIMGGNGVIEAPYFVDSITLQ